MDTHFFIGVDGGATKTIIRVEEASGALIGEMIGGPANIRLSVEDAWHSILSALTTLLTSVCINLKDSNFQFHAGFGLAGVEVETACLAFESYLHPFKTLLLTSDAHVACIGAHAGRDGAIIIAGTGVAGFQIESGKISKVGGWGFPQDDEGGGAWLGLEAAKETLKWLDGRSQISALAEVIYQHFDEDMNALVSWSNQANSTAFAQLAPLVMKASEAGDLVAKQLLKRAAQAIDSIGETLLSKQQSINHSPLPCALIGGVAPFLEPLLGEALRTRLQPAVVSPDQGAIYLVRNAFREL